MDSFRSLVFKFYSELNDLNIKYNDTPNVGQDILF